MAKPKKEAAPDSKPGAGKDQEKLPAKDSLSDEFKVVKKNKEDKIKASPNSVEDLQEDDRELGGEG